MRTRSAGEQQCRGAAAEEHRRDRQIDVAQHPPGQPDLLDHGVGVSAL